ncbi:hypothetical protein DV738_g1075, partial [Chaetothyriales sp. CBS 135597]
MGAGTLVSLALFLLPIGVSLGILLGLDAYRSSNGQPRLFLNQGVKNQTFCQTTYGITPNVIDGQQYTLNPNQWGLDDGESSNLCMNVTIFNNATYPTKTTAPAWSITWQYAPKAVTAPVHGFPNIKIDSDNIFPILISDLDSVNVDVDWMYSVGDTPAATLDTTQFSRTEADINTNVAIDIFLDPDSTKAQDTVKAKYEIMVWLATFGTATQQIGYADGAKDSVTLADGIAFDLYFGENTVTNQIVLTWVSSTALTTFNGDISPLLKKDYSSLGGPSTSDYMGYMALGSEVLNSNVNVTLSVPHLSMNITKS